MPGRTGFIEMHKDLKIGLVLGLILVIFVSLRLATDPRLSTKARMEHLDGIDSNSVTDMPASRSIMDTLISKPAAEDVDNKPVDNKNELLAIDMEITTSENNNLDTNPAPPLPDNNLPDIRHRDEAATRSNEQTEKIKPQRFHIVTKNQTLSDIAYKYYGSASKWSKIFEANRNVLSDPDKLQPGMKLIIPE